MAIDASWGDLDFKYSRFSEDALASGMDYWMVMPYMAKNKASIGIQYEIQFSSGMLVPRLDLSYYSDFFTNATNIALGRVKGQALGNARISWRPSNSDWEAALGLTNLFDRYYYNNATFSATGTATASPARPREWFVSFKYRF